MSSLPWAAILSGAIFGLALTASGVYSPSIITSQMRFSNNHMLKSFLSASASSAYTPPSHSLKPKLTLIRIAIYFSNRLRYTSNPPRTPSTLALFGTYDGNVIGGLLLGCGMALTGACPGTVLPQLATGIPSAPLVLLGSLLGGVLYSYFRGLLKAKLQDKKQALKKPTLYQKLGTSEEGAICMYVLLCGTVVTIANALSPKSGEVLLDPVVGGVAIGGSQVASLALTGNTLGISSAYEQVGELFWWAVSSRSGPRPSIRSTAFALGTVLGALSLSRLVVLPTSPKVEIGALKSVVGGVMLLFGSRLAGGCTSGHGISGMSQLSVASLVTVAAMFGGGIGWAAVFG
jgi:uncharacterized membrane protein YedE/YeeE